MENPIEKSNSNKHLIIILLVVCLLAVSGYFIYDKFFVKKEEETNKINTIENLAIDDSLVLKLYGYVKNEPNCIFYNSYFWQQKSLSATLFDDKEKYYLAFRLIDINDIKITPTTEESNPKFEIPFNIYDKAMKKIFGDNVVYSTTGEYSFLSDKSIDNNSFINFKYNAQTNSYVGEASGAGGTCSIVLPFYNKLVSATKVENKIIIKEKFIFTSDDAESLTESELSALYAEGKSPKISYKIYADYNKSILIYQSELLDRETIDSNPITIDNYLDKVNTITYTFTLGSDNEYHYTSSEVEK